MIFTCVRGISTILRTKKGVIYNKKFCSHTYYNKQEKWNFLLFDSRMSNLLKQFEDLIKPATLPVVVQEDGFETVKNTLKEVSNLLQHWGKTKCMLLELRCTVSDHSDSLLCCITLYCSKSNSSTFVGHQIFN